MNATRKTDNSTLSGWSAVGAMMALAATKTLTALAIAAPIEWLVRHVFAGAPLRFLFGEGGLGYWRCVGLFAVWHLARIRIKISVPARIEIEGDR